jgi:UDP-glucose 4-epimerase
MRALVTGGAGFIGSHLTQALLEDGDSVVALDDFSSGSQTNIDRFKDDERFSCVSGSILDAQLVERLVAQSDTVFHLAAMVGVQNVLDHPIETLETNVLGTHNVIRSAHATGNKHTVIASSSEVYGKSKRLPYTEEDDHLPGPTSSSRWGYACSKAMDEFLAMGYSQQRNLPVVMLRLFNTVGPRQSGRYGMVMPRFVSQALHDEPITVYGDGSQTRCFTSVFDVVHAMIEITRSPAAQGQVFNLGSDHEISVLGLAELVKRTLGSSSEIVHVPHEQVYGPQFEEPARRVPDISKIQHYIEYHPNTDLVAIIRQVATAMGSPKRTS